MADQSSGRAAKSRFAFLYHPIPEIGFFHRPFMSFNALSCVLSPCSTASLRCLSCAFMTSSAVFPLSLKSHGPPICLHVIVFISFPLLSWYSTANRDDLVRMRSSRRLTMLWVQVMTPFNRRSTDLLLPSLILLSTRPQERNTRHHANQETERLAAEVAAQPGKTKTGAVRYALRQVLDSPGLTYRWSALTTRRRPRLARGSPSPQ